MDYRLGDIADRFGLALQGDPDGRVGGVCDLTPGVPGRLAFLADTRRVAELAQTRAQAVIMPAEHVPDSGVTALIADDPKLAYARVAGLFERPRPGPGVHPRACVAGDAHVDPGASIAANAVVCAGARIAAGVRLEPGCVIGQGAVVGADSRVGANASIAADVQLGERVNIGAGAMLGERGFGLVPDNGAWRDIPQLGRVVIGDDVEIGAGCTIDRGAIQDTVIEQGAKLDDQVHIAHNCVIGAHTVIAGCTGIAGSCRIGRHCMLGGGVGISDHVTLADGVVLAAAAQVTSDILQPGVYSCSLRAMPIAKWNRSLALIKQLDRLAGRLRKLERTVTRKGS